MTAPRLLYGLNRLPGTLSADDPRLPSVDLSARSLRLNSVPLPVDAWGSGAADRASRMAAMQSWLLAACGDYNERLRRGVTRYLDLVTTYVAENRDALDSGLAPYHGLYQAEDWYWSALRPLPRAWWRQGADWRHADLAFWNGQTVIVMAPQDVGSDLPAAFRHFWKDQVLPVSPFRRPFPAWPEQAYDGALV